MKKPLSEKTVLLALSLVAEHTRELRQERLREQTLLRCADGTGDIKTAIENRIATLDERISIAEIAFRELDSNG